MNVFWGEIPVFSTRIFTLISLNDDIHDFVRKAQIYKNVYGPSYKSTVVSVSVRVT